MVRQHSYDPAKNRQRGRRDRSQEPSTLLTLEMASGDPPSDEPGAAHSQPAARRPSPPHLQVPGGFVRGSVALP